MKSAMLDLQQGNKNWDGKKLQTASYKTRNNYYTPETNVAPENGWLEYYFPFGVHVSFRQGIIIFH